jgi:hypothetical protein
MCSRIEIAAQAQENSNAFLPGQQSGDGKCSLGQLDACRPSVTRTQVI